MSFSTLTVRFFLQKFRKFSNKEKLENIWRSSFWKKSFQPLKKHTLTGVSGRLGPVTFQKDPFQNTFTSALRLIFWCYTSSSRERFRPIFFHYLCKPCIFSLEYIRVRCFRYGYMNLTFNTTTKLWLQIYDDLRCLVRDEIDAAQDASKEVMSKLQLS